MVRITLLALTGAGALMGAQAAYGQSPPPPPLPTTRGVPVMTDDGVGGVALMRDLEGSVSAVFDPGSKSARVKLVETDNHGVEGLRYLKPGQFYRGGWRLTSVAAREVVLRRGRRVLRVDISRGWTVRLPPIQPAILVQPGPAPGGAAQPPRRPAGGAPGAQVRPAVNAGLGLSNARVGGSPPPTPPAPPQNGQPFNAPGGPFQVSVDGAGNTVLTGPGGRQVQLPPGMPPPPF